MIRTRTLFKCLLLVYILTLIVIMSKLHFDQTFNQNMMLQEFENRHHAKQQPIYINRTIEIIRNLTRTVYVNKTLIRFKERWLPNYGPGENGTKVELEKTALSAEILNQTETNRKLHGFDTLVSDIVSLHRKLPDVRPQACKEIVYPENLPQISVVIIFRDEWPSILLRTAYSVMENSPPELIKEVVLVDDGSLNEDLRIKVDVHVATVEQFKLVRHKKSLGLMLARQRGIEATTADYFAVMDGHMEVSPGWLEPLLYRLTQEPNALLCSHVGVIYQDNFGFFVDKENIEEQGFDEQFPFFDPLTLDQAWAYFKDSFRQKRNHSVSPLEYGTIQGMMAVMRKDFFMRLGGFDPGMKIWGAEQMELSVKVWLCGGRVEMIPCSKVGHMYRITPWGSVKTKSNYYAANKRRMVDVWLDEPYRGYVLESIKSYDYEFGDLSDRHRIRIENKCKPYITFLEKVKEFSDVFEPSNVRQKGLIYNEWANQCMDLAFLNETDKFKLGMYQCHGNSNQYFLLTENLQIRTFGNLLISITEGNSTEIQVIKTNMNFYGERSYWRYNPNHTISHTATGNCLTIMADLRLQLLACTGSVDQVWKWGPYVKERQLE